ncbi:MAG: hypothetical protein JSU98_05190 [Gemmatimonadales bacterium]|nr:MAG: hypothetical protein JSU98_05190 [Gemmatimonadales bacterium]
MSRIIVPAAFLAIAGLVIWSAFLVTNGTTTQSLLVNLGTEIVGIVITVAVVEWFFERRRSLERARQLAWSALHASEHGIWVWQGGPREVETDQLLGMLKAVTAEDPLPDFTQNLLLGLGTRAKHLLHNELPALESMPGLLVAFEELARLNAIREGGKVTPPRKVADILELGVEGLARVLGQPTEPMPARLIRYVDASEEAQEQRYFGGDQGGGPRRIASPATQIF